MELVAEKYKQSDVGLIPSDWEVRTIGSFTDVCAGGTPSTFVREFWNGDIRWMNSGELNLKQVFEVENRITELGLNNSATRLIPVNCILIGLAGQGKTRGTVAINKIELCTNQSIAAIFPCDKVDYNFLYFNLDSRYSELRGLSTGDGGRGGLNLTIIKNLKIPLPPTKAEQTAIATALSDMDALIAQTEKLIEKKKAIKQGVMQELLRPKEGWVTKKLGEVVLRISTGLNPRTNFKLNAGGNNYYVTIKNFKNGNLFLDDKCDRIDDEALKLINNRSDLRVGDILLASIGRVGDLYLIKEQPKNWNINESVFTLRPNVSMIDPEYLCCLFDQDSIKSTLGNGATGSTFQSIKVGDLRKLELCFPAEIREQKEISSILTDMTFMIDQFEIRLKKLKHQKQGMMQALLTGKIRLI